jgi:hypothetical protein
MKLLCLLVFVGAATLAFGEEKKSENRSIDFNGSQVSENFGLAQAQALADARRIDLYGVYSMSVFKEKVGPIWTFATKVGYAGTDAPDISVIEPAIGFPASRGIENEANQRLELNDPSRHAGCYAPVAPAGVVAHP